MPRLIAAFSAINEVLKEWRRHGDMTCTAADVVGILSGRGAGNSGLNSDAQLLVREGLARHILVISRMTPAKVRTRSHLKASHCRNLAGHAGYNNYGEIMQFDKVKEKCLRQFAARYPGDNRVIVVKRSDGNVKVLNACADSILFDRKGQEVVTEQYLEGLRSAQVTAVEATFEELS